MPQTIVDLDQRDPLAPCRAKFDLPAYTFYLDGNSLGPLPKAARQRISDLVDVQWGTDLIRSWNKHNWIDLPRQVGEKVASLIGAAKGQTLCCDSISVNLFKLLASALQVNKQRSVVLSQTDNFPTDLYTVEGLSRLLGEQRCRLKTVSAEQLYTSLDESVAVLLLTQVNFRSGLAHDIAALTQRAHEVGALVIWDLAHSAGALPLHLDQWQVDFAVGCGYKFLNGGPGAPAFLYVAKRHQASIEQPLSGWMGHAAPFDFEPNYQAAPGVERFLSGTPSVIAMSALDAALDIFDGLSMAQIRAKSVALGELLIELVTNHPVLSGLTLASPSDANERGSQVAFSHPDAFPISQALIDRGVVIDFRAPDLLRFGITPLYTRFEDLFFAVDILNEVVNSGSFRQDQYQHRSKVT